MAHGRAEVPGRGAGRGPTAVTIMNISILDLEEAAARGWRAPEMAVLGRWWLRAAEGFTGRANSALAIGDPGMPLAAAISEVRRWYRARGLPAMVAVPFPVGRPQDSAVDQVLGDELGWPLRSAVVTVMTGAPEAVAGTSAGAAMPVDVDAEPDQGWLALYRFRGQEPPPISRRLLMSAPWQAFASVREAGHTLAIGRVAAAGDWAGLTAVEVDPRHRRRGLGRAITRALAAAAAGRGVTGLYLQVEDDNPAAHRLYDGMGFADHHAYHYRVAPPRGDLGRL
jgi:ribosomal protein S18 acetylase RimI-like enzyme